MMTRPIEHKELQCSIWYDDDETLTNPLPSMKKPSRDPRVEQQTGVGEEVREALTRRVPEHRVEGIVA